MGSRREVFDEILDDHDEMLLEMATIGYASKSPKSPEYIITVDKADTRRGAPYFKFYDGNSVDRGTRVARISYRSATYFNNHTSPSHPPFKLSRRQKEALVKFFNEPYVGDKDLNNWQYAIITYNNEKCRLGAVSGRSLNVDFKKVTKKVKESNPELKFVIPIDQKMPNYMLL